MHEQRLATYIFLYVLLFIYIKEIGLKETFHKWKTQFVENKAFRKVFLLVLYTSMILVKTVLARPIWHDPYGRIFLDWRLVDEYGYLSFEIIENIILFVPFTFLFAWNFYEKIEGNNIVKLAGITTGVGLLLSCGIELTQLVTRLGTFQFSDIFYNTLGGMIGALLYLLLQIIIHLLKHK